MIQANELRIGNWVKFGNFQATLDSIQGDVGCDPITLTPEILEKCGFEKDGFNAWVITLPTMLTTSACTLAFAGDYLYLRQENNHRRSDDSICCLWNKDLMKSFYLHQLQNLYFTLTGQELTINL